ncbi:hypothetical protein AVEN_273801-1 [Araneus ventricosus]|uniref:Uncharacterized protein n=1 Tax=Araneus ventricosus TaxID=182803 RepID=A0A4Y2F5D3_ARAVE|nr:hypothetical protein AVEN_273801-1 [Araneus ventricosus]
MRYPLISAMKSGNIYETGTFGLYWIRCDGPMVHWPVASPELSCPDFFCGHMEAKVRENSAKSDGDFVHRIFVTAGKGRDTAGIFQKV